MPVMTLCQASAQSGQDEGDMAESAALSLSLGISDPSSVESLYYTSSESGDEDHDTLSGDHHVMHEDSILDDGEFL